MVPSSRGVGPAHTRARPRIHGEVVETGQGFTKFKKGDRIVVPFNINCGECRQCKLGNFSCCQRSNRNAAMAADQFGYTTAGLFGHTHPTPRLSEAGGGPDHLLTPGPRRAPTPIVQKSLTLVSGQTSVKRYLEPLTQRPPLLIRPPTRAYELPRDPRRRPPSVSFPDCQ